MDEMTKRFEELYDNMATSKDHAKMHVFGNAEKWLFPQLVVLQPKLARQWLDKLEASEWNNYLSQTEAEDIVAKLENQNGSHGGKWTFTAFEQAVENMGKHTEHAPYFNNYALWAVANMKYSDHARSLSEALNGDKEKLFALIYALSVEQLTDPDRPRFVREYFHV